MKQNWKRQAVALQRRVDELEARILHDEQRYLTDYATDLRKIVASVPKRPRFVGCSAPAMPGEVREALEDLVETWLDTDGLSRVFDFCDLLGVRPMSRLPADVIDAITELTWRATLTR